MRQAGSITTSSLSARNVIPADKIDSIQTNVQTKIDSLTTFNPSTTKIGLALDSINTLRDSTLAALNGKLQLIKDKTIGKLNSSNIPPSLKQEISEATKDIEGFKIPISDLGIPASDLNLPSLSGVGNISLPEPGGLNIPSVPKLDGVSSLKEVGVKTVGVPSVVGNAGGYANDVKALASGNLDEVKELPKTAETKLAEMSGLNEATGQAQVLDKYKDMSAQMKDPDSLKVIAKQEIRQMAVNHFAGKEEQLQQAMGSVSKLKLKYTSINNLKDVAKRPPNEMKGKPLIERIVPGLAMQVHKAGDDLMVDFNAYAGYRFTGRLTSGIGWNQRVVYNPDTESFNPDARVFGPRVFTEFKLWKGFSPRAEVENMNTKVPPSTLSPSTDPDGREWVWGVFLGLKKDYRLFKNVKGTALVMTRLYNPDRKSPYAEVLNLRFGFEFPMKKKIKIADRQVHGM